MSCVCATAKRRRRQAARNNDHVVKRQRHRPRRPRKTGTKPSVHKG